MDDPDLQLLRAFRADEVEPPEGLRERIEKQLWLAILEEESVAGGRRAGMRATVRRWYEGLLRPAVAAGAALTIAIVVAVASDGGTAGTATGTSGIRQASVGMLDSTATSLFGGSPATTTSPIVGTIDVTDANDARRQALVAGPAHDRSTGVLNAVSAEFARSAPRDPASLRDELRTAVGADPGDRLAFRYAMAWVVDPAVPTDLRATMLRSLEGMAGLDDAMRGADLLGRTGIVLGHSDSSSGMRDQYLLDPRSGRLLEQRSSVTSYVDPACPPGTVTEHALFADSGELVEQGDAPWIDWPQVVAACEPGGVGG